MPLRLRQKVQKVLRQSRVSRNATPNRGPHRTLTLQKDGRAELFEDGGLRVDRPTLRRDRGGVGRAAVAEEKSGLVLTKKAGNMKLFLNDLDDLHQWDFIQNQKMVKENERLRVFSRMLHEQWESWKHRALVAEAKLVDAKASTPIAH
jgi:hypothetical protein